MALPSADRYIDPALVTRLDPLLHQQFIPGHAKVVVWNVAYQYGEPFVEALKKRRRCQFHCASTFLEVEVLKMREEKLVADRHQSTRET
jgi:hypothetical protein